MKLEDQIRAQLDRALDDNEKLQDRVSELLRFNNEYEERYRAIKRSMEINRTVSEGIGKAREAYIRTLIEPIARPISEYHEDMGAMLWWCFESGNKTCEACSGDGSINKHANVADVKCEACNGWGHIPGPLKLKGEPPYVGTPNDLGFEVNLLTPMGNYQCYVGG